MAKKLKSAISGLLSRATIGYFHKKLSFHEYWEERVRNHGKRSVLNLNHREEDFEAVTEKQKQEIYPHFQRELRGDEKIIVDFGCGPGRFSGDLAQMTGGRCIAVDIVAGLLDMAPKSRTVEYAVLRDCFIPLPDEYADVVWICLVLGGIDGEELAKVVAEIRRVLRPGGLLFIVENTSEQPNGAYWHFRSVLQYQKMFPFAGLSHLHDYQDLGERISIMSGRKY